MTKNKKIKVAFYVPSFIVGGVETIFINTVSELLKNKNIDITVITHAKIREPFYVNWFKEHPEIHTYTYYALCNWFQDLEPKCHGLLKTLRKISFSLYKRFRRFMCWKKFRDIDVFIDYKNFESVRELSYKNKPKIAWAHSALSYFERDARLPKKVRPYNKVVCLTDEFLEDFKVKYPEYSDKILRIYNPINVEYIQQLAQSGDAPSGKYFCHISRLDWGKDIKTLLDAFDIFYKSHKDVKLYIIGDGCRSDYNKEYASTLKSSKNIIFTGTIYNPFPYMKGAMANILSTEFEGLPTVVLESVALGVPCISSNCKSGPKEILLKGKAGLLFEIGDVNKLAEHMLNVYSGNIDKANMQKNMKKSISRFNPSVIANQIYEMIINTVKEYNNEKNI